MMKIKITALDQRNPACMSSKLSRQRDTRGTRAHNTNIRVKGRGVYFACVMKRHGVVPKLPVANDLACEQAAQDPATRKQWVPGRECAPVGSLRPTRCVHLQRAEIHRANGFRFDLADGGRA